MRNVLTALLAMCVVASHGSTFESGLFLLNTTNLIGHASSPEFLCATHILSDQQESALFSLEFTYGQQISGIFTLNSESPKFASASALVDTHTVPIDSDGNGLPNIWEMLYFNVLTGTVATVDADGDGNSNRDEYVTGTHPLDEQSCFAIYLDTATGLLEWNTVLNRLYTLEHTYNLTNSFVPVPGYNDIPGTGENDYYIGISDEATNEFFRVQVLIVE